MIAFAVFVGLVIGIIVGAVGRPYIVKEASVTKEELAAWAQRLRNVLAVDAETAKQKVNGLVTEMERKIF